ncbi:unnamed protein product [Symbiodinium sp. KB8]|nr:unnamed protein product [Symbiodinium sp. KB8]
MDEASERAKQGGRVGRSGWRGAHNAHASQPAGKSLETWEVPCEEVRNSDATLQLRSGIQMPRFGLGTWQSQRGGECKRAVAEALRAGYRLIDTAQAYGNELDVGQALREARLHRNEVFVVTKLNSREHGGSHAAAALKTSLSRLQLDYVDLFLIHSPRGGFLLETWDSLIELRNAGLTRLLSACPTSVNQIELHCFWQQRETESLCNELGIALMAYSPLARGSLFGATPLAQLAQEKACSEAALCIRWAFQKGFIVIPKSVNPQRILANIAALRGPGLTPREMQAMEQLDQGFCACPAARAMQTPWEEVASKAPVRKGKGKGKVKGKGGKGKGQAEASEHFASWAETFS